MVIFSLKVQVLGVNENTLHEWIKRFREKSATLFPEVANSALKMKGMSQIGARKSRGKRDSKKGGADYFAKVISHPFDPKHGKSTPSSKTVIFMLMPRTLNQKPQMIVFAWPSKTSDRSSCTKTRCKSF